MCFHILSSKIQNKLFPKWSSSTINGVWMLHTGEWQSHVSTIAPGLYAGWFALYPVKGLLFQAGRVFFLLF
jgi:hypothetical protein